MRSIRQTLPNSAWYVVCGALAVLFLYPIVAMVLQSFKPTTEAAASPPTFLPHQWSFENYAALHAPGLDLLHGLGVSVLVAVTTMVFSTVLAVLGGYGLSRLRFPGSGIAFFAILITFMVPFQAIITPLFTVLSHVGLTNSITGLVLVIGTFHLPFGLFVMRNAFLAVPAALEEAAMLDGLGIIGTMTRVIMPVSVPGIVTTALFGFFAAWNEFFAPLVLVSDQSKYTLSVLLSIVQTGEQGSLNWGVLEAGVVLTALPCIIIFVLLQKYYINGLVTGAVK